MKDKPEDTYLGDGVYASYEVDRDLLWLDLRAQASSSHSCRIALEPETLAAMDRYRNCIKDFYAARKQQE